MNLLYILETFPNGCGVDTVTRILSDEFIGMNHNVSICCVKKSKGFAAYSEKIRIHYFPGKKLLSGENIIFLHGIIETENINIMINQYSQDVNYSILCDNARKSTDARLINCHHLALLLNSQVHGRFLFRFLPDFMVNKLKQMRQLRMRNRAYSIADLTVFLSQRIVEQYKRLEPEKKLDKLRFIHNPLQQTNYSAETKENMLLFVGRINEMEKRLSLIIRIWKEICEKYPDWKLTVVGDGPSLKSTEKMAENVPRILFEGWKDPGPYYAKSKIFIMTSNSFEGLPVVILEAQQHLCVPIVMESFLTLGDVIDNEKNGIIIPNNDVGIFIEKLTWLMDNEKLRNEFALNGASTCKKFDVKIIAKKWEELFFEVMNA